MFKSHLGRLHFSVAAFTCFHLVIFFRLARHLPPFYPICVQRCETLQNPSKPLNSIRLQCASATAKRSWRIRDNIKDDS